MAGKAKRGGRIMDPAERDAFVAERRDEERQRIEDSVRELATSEGVMRWINVRARFTNYSLNNQLLIAMQLDRMGLEASGMVAGYRAWQGLGRQVRKGEKGIRIMAPMTYRKAKGEKPEKPSAGLGASVAQGVAAARDSIYDADRTEYETRQAFRSVSVFDVAQTEGDELPENPFVTVPIEGDELAGYLPALGEFAESIGYSFDVEPIPPTMGALGYCDSGNKRIVIEAGQSVNAQVATGVHELAHALGALRTNGYSLREVEVMAEASALMVMATLGLDISGRSIPYLAMFGGGDVKPLRDYAAKVDELATRIEKGIGAKDAPDAKHTESARVAVAA